MRTKRYKGNGRLKYIMVLSVVAAIASYLAYPVFFSDLIPLKADPYQSVDVSESGDVDSFLPYAGCLLHLKGSMLRLLDGKGQKVWEVNLEGSNLGVFVIGDNIAIHNPQQNRLNGLNGDGNKIWSYSPSGSVKRISSDGRYIWIKYIKDGKGIIEVVNDQGHGVAYIPVGNVEVLDVSVSKDAKHIAVSAARLDDGQLTGSLVLYRPDGAIAWAKSHKDMLMLKTRITDDNKVIALAERGLSSYDIDGLPIWQRDIKGYISGVYITEQGYTALATVQDYRAGIPGKNPENVSLYDIGGNSIASYGFSDRLTGIAGADGFVVLVSGRMASVIDLSNGRAVKLDFASDINSVCLLDKNSLVCVSAGQVLFNSIEW
jgi:hypothetical protein